ncbi:MAG: methyltransferase, partial [Candidatus Omnitrophica bacterium]|nr:methyltransferase [Candidatus Omnitrophota bacterium]
PEEETRIVPEAFGHTEMGRDLLGQDYLLKQIASSALNPNEALGKKFWDEVYRQAQEKFGTTDIPVDTRNRVWIVPADVIVYEKADAGKKAAALVVKAKLTVMLETDYLAIEKGKTFDVGRQTSDAGLEAGVNGVSSSDVSRLTSDPLRDRGSDASQELSKQIMREIIIPALEKEVNEGEHFSRLRQIYHSFILAAWYKKKLNDSIVMSLYMDKNKVAGVDTGELDAPQRIYDQYVESFKKGVFDFIKEEKDGVSDELIPRKYFSGGIQMEAAMKIEKGDDTAQKFLDEHPQGLLAVSAGAVPTSYTTVSPGRKRDLTDVQIQGPVKSTLHADSILLSQLLSEAGKKDWENLQKVLAAGDDPGDVVFSEVGAQRWGMSEEKRTVILPLRKPVRFQGRIWRAAKIKGTLIPLKGPIETLDKQKAGQPEVTLEMKDGKPSWQEIGPMPKGTTKFAEREFGNYTYADENGIPVNLDFAHGTILDRVYEYEEGGEKKQAVVRYLVTLLPDVEPKRLMNVLEEIVGTSARKRELGDTAAFNKGKVEYVDYVTKYARLIRRLNEKAKHGNPNMGNMDVFQGLLAIEDLEGLRPLSRYSLPADRLGYILRDLRSVLNSIKDLMGYADTTQVRVREYQDESGVSGIVNATPFFDAVRWRLWSEFLKEYFKNTYKDPKFKDVFALLQDPAKGFYALDNGLKSLLIDSKTPLDQRDTPLVHLFKEEFKGSLAASEAPTSARGSSENSFVVEAAMQQAKSGGTESARKVVPLIQNEHVYAYRQIERAIGNKEIPSGLPVILIDQHSDSDDVDPKKEPQSWNWISYAKQRGLIGKSLWLHPEGRGVPQGDQQGAFRSKGSDFEALVKANKEHLKGGVILSVDMDYFASKPVMGQMGHVPHPGEIGMLLRDMILILEEQGIKVRLFNGAYSVPQYALEEWKQEFTDAMNEVAERRQVFESLIDLPAPVLLPDQDALTKARQNFHDLMQLVSSFSSYFPIVTGQVRVGHPAYEALLEIRKRYDAYFAEVTFFRDFRESFLEKAGPEDYQQFFDLVRDEMSGIVSSIRILAKSVPELQNNKFFPVFDDLMEKIIVMAPQVASGKYDLKEVHRRDVNVRSFLDEVTSLFSRRKNISFSTQGSNVLTANVDPFKLGHVFINLITNAIQAIGEKPGIITISYRKDGGFVEFIVTDNGPGIDKKDLPHIFDVGFTKGDHSGTGLGLGICLDVVKAHGGTIGPKSEEGKGASFTIRLPLESAMKASQGLAFQDFQQDREKAVKSSEMLRRKYIKRLRGFLGRMMFNVLPLEKASREVSGFESYITFLAKREITPGLGANFFHQYFAFMRNALALGQRAIETRVPVTGGTVRLVRLPVASLFDAKRAFSLIYFQEAETKNKMPAKEQFVGYGIDEVTEGYPPELGFDLFPDFRQTDRKFSVRELFEVYRAAVVKKTGAREVRLRSSQIFETRVGGDPARTLRFYLGIGLDIFKDWRTRSLKIQAPASWGMDREVLTGDFIDWLTYKNASGAFNTEEGLNDLRKLAEPLRNIGFFTFFSQEGEVIFEKAMATLREERAFVERTAIAIRSFDHGHAGDPVKYLGRAAAYANYLMDYPDLKSPDPVKNFKVLAKDLKAIEAAVIALRTDAGVSKKWSADVVGGETSRVEAEAWEVRLREIRDEVQKVLSVWKQLVVDSKHDAFDDSSRVMNNLQDSLLIIDDRLRFIRGNPSQDSVDMVKLFGNLKEHFDKGFPGMVKVSHEVGEFVVPGDRLALINVFYNLMSNAAKAMQDSPEKSLVISVTKENGSVVVRLQDTGPGIPAEFLEDGPNGRKKLYDLNRTTKGSEAGQTKGGLGTTETYLAVALHGGKMDVKADPAGTTFTVSLPFVRQEKDGEDVSAIGAGQFVAQERERTNLDSRDVTGKVETMGVGELLWRLGTLVYAKRNQEIDKDSLDAFLEAILKQDSGYIQKLVMELTRRLNSGDSFIWDKTLLGADLLARLAEKGGLFDRIDDKVKEQLKAKKHLKRSADEKVEIDQIKVGDVLYRPQEDKLILITGIKGAFLIYDRVDFPSTGFFNRELSDHQQRLKEQWVRVESAMISSEPERLRLKDEKLWFQVRDVIGAQIAGGDKVLEIGTGIQGVLTKRLAEGAGKKKVDFWATDIDEVSAAGAKKALQEYPNVTVMQGDLFEPVKGKKFNKIFWNPPWYGEVRAGKRNDGAYLDKNYESLRLFLEQAPDYLEPGGKIFVIFPQEESEVLWDVAPQIGLEIEEHPQPKHFNPETEARVKQHISVYEFTPSNEPVVVKDVQASGEPKISRDQEADAGPVRVVPEGFQVQELFKSRVELGKQVSDLAAVRVEEGKAYHAFLAPCIVLVGYDASGKARTFVHLPTSRFDEADAFPLFLDSLEMATRFVVIRGPQDGDSLSLVSDGTYQERYIRELRNFLESRGIQPGNIYEHLPRIKGDTEMKTGLIVTLRSTGQVKLEYQYISPHKGELPAVELISPVEYVEQADGTVRDQGAAGEKLPVEKAMGPLSGLPSQEAMTTGRGYSLKILEELKKNQSRGMVISTPDKPLPAEGLRSKLSTLRSWTDGYMQRPGNVVLEHHIGGSVLKGKARTISGEKVIDIHVEVTYTGQDKPEEKAKRVREITQLFASLTSGERKKELLSKGYTRIMGDTPNTFLLELLRRKGFQDAPIPWFDAVLAASNYRYGVRELGYPPYNLMGVRRVVLSLSSGKEDKTLELAMKTDDGVLRGPYPAAISSEEAVNMVKVITSNSDMPLEFIDVLGMGRWGAVFKVKDQKGTVMALKIPGGWEFRENQDPRVLQQAIKLLERDDIKSADKLEKLGFIPETKKVYPFHMEFNGEAYQASALLMSFEEVKSLKEAYTSGMIDIDSITRQVATMIREMGRNALTTPLNLNLDQIIIYPENLGVRSDKTLVLLDRGDIQDRGPAAAIVNPDKGKKERRQLVDQIVNGLAVTLGQGGLPWNGAIRREVVEEVINGNVDKGREASEPGSLERETAITVAKDGGINLGAGTMDMKTTGSGGDFHFNLSPEDLKAYQDASGLTPVIFSIQPLESVPKFLGMVEAGASVG